MKLYYSPLACSLADHIALEEAGASFESETVDLKTKRTGSGEDFTTVTRKGYVPALVLDSGETLTENVAVLDWIASQYPALGFWGRQQAARHGSRSSVHEPFSLGAEAMKTALASSPTTATDRSNGRIFLLSYLLIYLAAPVTYIGVVQAALYLFVMLLWAARFQVPVPAPLQALRARIAARPAVRAAMVREGLV